MSGFRSITVRPGAETAFESAFDDTGMLTRPMQVDGFGGAELRRSMTAPDEYSVVGRWSSPAAYAAWHAISNDGAPPEALARLIDAIAEHRPGQLFRDRPGVADRNELRLHDDGPRVQTPGVRPPR